MVRLPRIAVKNRRLRVVLLLAGIAVALVPLVAVVVKDLQFLPVFSALIATAALLVLWGEGGEPRAAPAPPHPTAEAAVPRAPEVRSPAPVAERPPLASRPPSHHILAMLHVLAALDNEIIRLCELSPPPRQPIPASDARRSDVDHVARGK